MSGMGTTNNASDAFQAVIDACVTRALERAALRWDPVTPERLHRKHGYSTGKLAQATGVCKVTIRRIELGTNQSLEENTITTCLKLAQEIGEPSAVYLDAAQRAIDLRKMKKDQGAA